MSDLLLVGESPSGDVGKEYFLHCMDWWIDILQVIEACLDASYPFDAIFYRDLFLAPMTPHLSGEEAKTLAGILDECRERGELEQVVRQVISAGLYEEDDEDDLESRVEDRLDQIDRFITFLRACGGCRARWHGVND
jgi:hypothetical protein